MLFKSTFAALLTASLAMVRVNAESHTVTFDNKCGTGTVSTKAIPHNLQTLAANGSLKANNNQYVYSYLQTGNCGNNGEEGTLVETTLEVTTGFGFPAQLPTVIWSSPSATKYIAVKKGYLCYGSSVVLLARLIIPTFIHDKPT
ncbi:predicted protein [Postia placenta Mad-698-R]|nr:predicted protein [Postia placenta Mad-698-R]